MYITNKPYTFGMGSSTITVPKGATCINAHSLIWKQTLHSIRILAHQLPNKFQEIEYMLGDQPVCAILDVNDDLYLWELELVKVILD